MALKEISDLVEKLSVNPTDYLHVKQGSEDVKIVPSVLFDLHKAESNPHNISATTIGLDNVINAAQLQVSLNLSDLASVSTSRSNLGVYSTTEVDNAITAHSSLTNNPHSVTKAQVGLGNVNNYTISHDPNENVQTKYASIAAVNDVQTQVNNIVNGNVPAGGIIMWSTNNPIPSGWVICDGLNGTPDLRNKFIRGGDLFTVGDEGGSDTEVHSHSGVTSQDALTVAQLPPHHHKLRGQLLGGSGDTEGSSGRYQYSTTIFDDITIQDEGDGEPHGHSLAVNDSAPINNLPTYYTMIFIQKT